MDFPAVAILVPAFAAVLGVWCADVADRYSGALLTRVFAAPQWADDHQLLWQALGGGSKWLRLCFRFPYSCVSRRSCSIRAAKRGACAATMAVCALVFGGRYGLSAVFTAMMVAVAALLILALVDAATRLLPDVLTLAVLWIGLATAWLQGPVVLHDAVAAAMSGYAFLWLLFSLYGCIRKRRGMGHGDFKLLAALGAWVGLADLPGVLLAACLAGVVFSVVRNRRLNLTDSYPFGPFLVASGVGIMLLGPGVHSYF